MSRVAPAIFKNKVNLMFHYSAMLRYIWIYLLLIGITGLALFITLVFSNWNKSGISYEAEDVVYSNGIYVVHEMNPNSDQDTPYLPIVPSINQAKIQVSDQFYDFGVINSTDIVTRTFVIANMGQTPLIIEHAYTTCGCTTANITSSQIPPGKVALMNLQFNPTLHNIRSSTVRRGVILRTNDPERPLQEIWIQATVR